MTYESALRQILEAYKNGEIGHNTRLLSLGFLSVLECEPMDYETMSQVLQRHELGIRSVVRNYLKRDLVLVANLRSSQAGGRRCNCYALTDHGQRMLSCLPRFSRSYSRTIRAEVYQELRFDHPDRTFSSIVLLAATELSDGSTSSLVELTGINHPALMQQITRAIDTGLMKVKCYETSQQGGSQRVIIPTASGQRLMQIFMQL